MDKLVRSLSHYANQEYLDTIAKRGLGPFNIQQDIFTTSKPLIHIMQLCLLGLALVAHIAEPETIH